MQYFKQFEEARLIFQNDLTKAARKIKILEGSVSKNIKKLNNLNIELENAKIEIKNLNLNLHEKEEQILELKTIDINKDSISINIFNLIKKVYNKITSLFSNNVSLPEVDNSKNDIIEENNIKILLEKVLSLLNNNSTNLRLVYLLENTLLKGLNKSVACEISSNLLDSLIKNSYEDSNIFILELYN